MSFCACGNDIDGDGTTCARCDALQILGLPIDATKEDVERTYRILVKVWHPDRFQTDEKMKQAADEKLKSINAAHVFLQAWTPPLRRKRSKSNAAHQKSAPDRTQTGPTDAASATPQSESAVQRSSSFTSAIALRGLLFLCVLLAFAAIVFGLDSMLLSNSTTGPTYSGLRAEILGHVESNVSQAWDDLVRHSHPMQPASTGSTGTATASDTNSKPAAPPSSAMQPAKVLHVNPFTSYVTIGFTKDQVVAALGTPSSSSDQAMTYDGSVLYFMHGKVAGWKIDPASPPIRVRMLPSSPIPSDLKTFTLGSSRNEVLAVQGSPTLCTADKFGYGNSEVFFENARVIGWKNDPASVKLHVSNN